MEDDYLDDILDVEDTWDREPVKGDALDKIPDLDKRLAIVERTIKNRTKERKAMQEELGKLSETLQKWEVEFAILVTETSANVKKNKEHAQENKERFAMIDNGMKELSNSITALQKTQYRVWALIGGIIVVSQAVITWMIKSYG